jgi:hypothetical protein
MHTKVAEALDVLKLFIVIGDVDFRALTTAGPRMRNEVTRSAGTLRTPSTALARLIDEINTTRPRTRDATPARSPSSPWSVQELRVRTVQQLP